MEWQLVTIFFVGSNARIPLQHIPTPGIKTKRLDSVIISKKKFFFDNPKDVFALDGGKTLLLARNHIAAAYPALKHNAEEFVFLERAINGDAKGQVR
jgi:hypothetical protein